MKGTISKQQAEVLYSEHVDFIYRGALFLTKSRELADDITQDVFMKAFDKYHTFDETRAIKPWLYKIMINTARNVLKKQKYYFSLEMIHNGTNEEGVEQVVLQKEEDGLLWKRINKLSKKTKEVLFMHYYLDMKIEDVAQALEIPIGTCKSRLNAGLNKLREESLYKVGTKSKEVKIG